MTIPGGPQTNCDNPDTVRFDFTSSRPTNPAPPPLIQFTGIDFLNDAQNSFAEWQVKLPAAILLSRGALWHLGPPHLDEPRLSRSAICVAEDGPLSVLLMSEGRLLMVASGGFAEADNVLRLYNNGINGPADNEAEWNIAYKFALY